jgi:hypothetical protein
MKARRSGALTRVEVAKVTAAWRAQIRVVGSGAAAASDMAVSGA